MAGRPPIDETRRKAIRELHEQGVSYSSIRQQVTYILKSGRIANVSKAFISKVVKEAEQ